MKELKVTSQFKKDLKRYQNQPKRIEKLKVVLRYLQQGVAIPQEYKPHKLLGEYKDCMECHIESDALLIWFDENSNIVKLIRLGTHSELFKQSQKQSAAPLQQHPIEQYPLAAT